MTNRPIGFSTGCFYKAKDNYEEIDPYSAKALKIWSALQLPAIEIMCNQAEHASFLPGMVKAVKKFPIKSLHLPLWRYDANKETRALLRALSDFYQQVGATLAIVHPDMVKNWKVFKGFPMRFAVENMDDKKPAFQRPDEFDQFFTDQPDWSLVLDLNHIKCNDPSMAMAGGFIKKWGERIAEIHLSGCRNNIHAPLFNTKQAEIINSIPFGTCPIIIESPFVDRFGPQQELDYIAEVMALKQ